MKTVLITGATSGFGKELVGEFLKVGYQVVATGRRLTQRQEIFATERNHYQDRLVELDLDVTVSSEIDEVGQYFANKSLDVLINNAGFAVFGPAEECSDDSLRRQFDVNFFGLVALTQKLLPALRKSRGHILNFSSVFGFTGFPLSSLYCASKFAVEGFSESLAFELQPLGVKVTLIQPGGYRTNFNSGVEWGMTTGQEQSPYHLQIQNYTRLRHKLATRKKFQNPNDVARGVVKIVQKTEPKISYTFGRDALLTKIMRRLLNRNAYHRMVSRMTRKIFLKELT